MSGIIIEKKEKENTRQLVSRFSRAVRKSGILYRIKQNQFEKRPLSPGQKKKAALRREEIKDKYKKLEKLGRV
jgi:ribosomal protein S21